MFAKTELEEDQMRLYYEKSWAPYAWVKSPYFVHLIAKDTANQIHLKKRVLSRWVCASAIYGQNLCVRYHSKLFKAYRKSRNTRKGLAKKRQAQASAVVR